MSWTEVIFIPLPENSTSSDRWFWQLILWAACSGLTRLALVSVRCCAVWFLQADQAAVAGISTAAHKVSLRLLLCWDGSFRACFTKPGGLTGTKKSDSWSEVCLVPILPVLNSQTLPVCDLCTLLPLVALGQAEAALHRTKKSWFRENKVLKG